MGWEFNDFSDIIKDFKHKRFKGALEYIKIIVPIILIVSLLVSLLVTIGVGFKTFTSYFYHDGEHIALWNCRRYDDRVISQVSEKYDEEISLYDSSQLTPEIIANREGKILIERCVCYVDKFEHGQGSGTILNCFSPLLSSVHYENMDEEIRKGTIVITYFVYNPDGKYIDDVVEVFDFVLTREYEKEDIGIFDIIKTSQRISL